MGFNTQSIRDLNKIYITLSDEIGKPAETVFLYTDQGWDFTFNVSAGDTLLKGAKNLINNPLLGALFQTATGNASTVIDIQRKYLFTGSNPLEFTVRGYRYLETDVNTDILTPINTLLSWVLPTRGKELGSVADKGIAALAEKTNTQGAEGWSLLQKVKDLLHDFTGDMYVLQVPEAFKLEGRKMVVTIGGQPIERVFLKSISFKTPKFFYAKDKDGESPTPIPDRVDFTLAFESLRTAVKDDFTFKGK